MPVPDLFVSTAAVPVTVTVGRRWQPWVAGAVLLALFPLAHGLQGLEGGRTLVFALALGVLLGASLQRTRFCFYCHARDWFEQGDPRGVLAIFLALAVGVLGMTVVLSSWVADPQAAPAGQAGQLPPEMHIGPVSEVLVLAGLVFGAGMRVSGSCISAHWYRLAEGAAVSPFALLGTAAGFGLGFWTWNPLFSLAVADAPVLWLPAHLGYGGALALQLGGLALAAAWLWARQRPGVAPAVPLAPVVSAAQPPSLRTLWQRAWTGRWPYWMGGLAVGLLAVAAIVRMRPLGVTATLGSAVRRVGEHGGWLPERLNGLDSLGGCATVVRDALTTPNALVLLGLLAGAFIAALASRQFAPRRPTGREVLRGLGGGLLLGWGAMTGLGCTIGTLLSGSMAGAVSGWVFGLSLWVALWLGLRLWPTAAAR